MCGGCFLSVVTQKIPLPPASIFSPHQHSHPMLPARSHISAPARWCRWDSSVGFPPQSTLLQRGTGHWRQRPQSVMRMGFEQADVGLSRSSRRSNPNPNYRKSLEAHLRNRNAEHARDALTGSCWLPSGCQPKAGRVSMAIFTARLFSRFGMSISIHANDYFPDWSPWGKKIQFYRLNPCTLSKVEWRRRDHVYE